MKIGIGNDHAAVDMKNQVVEYLEGKGYEVVNFGTDTYESCNYPEYGEKVGRAVAARRCRSWYPDLWYRSWNLFGSK